MPSSLTYPGVYIEEIPSGVRTIIGVATSITAFVGRARRGPVNEPVTINSFADFDRTFGGLWNPSSLGFAVRDFFQNGGGQAIVVRLVHTNFVTPADRDAGVDAADKVATAAKGATDGKAAKAAADAAFKAIADEDARAFAQPVLDAINQLPDAATKAQVAAAADTSMPAVARSARLTVGTTNKLILEAVSPGTWGNDLRARVEASNPKSVPDSLSNDHLTAADVFNLIVRDVKAGITEVFLSVSVKPGSRLVSNVLSNESQLVRVLGTVPGSVPEPTDPTPLPPDLQKVEPFSDEDIKHASPSRSAGVATADQGTHGGDLDRNDFTTGPGIEVNKAGLYALNKADLFNLLCIPPHTSLGEVDSGLLSDAITLCERRRAMLIVDSTRKWSTVAKARDGMDAGSFPPARSKNAAIFFPRIMAANPLHNNQIEEFAPCGIVAGIFARTDNDRGVWKAPAGLDATIRGITALSLVLNDAENGELNPRGLNCLMMKPAIGPVVWGARTLQGDDRLASEWKYIPVRRTALYIEESLFRGTQWVVFEPNDEPLWAQIRLNVGAFMQNLFRQGAFQGTSPRDAYFVRCGKDTTTQSDINSGIVNIVVGFAPLKPAEFVVIKLQQIAGQIQT